MNKVYERFSTMFLQPCFHTIFVPDNACENKIEIIMRGLQIWALFCFPPPLTFFEKLLKIV